MNTPLLKAAEEEASDLRTQLEKSPIYRRLMAVEKFISDYRLLSPPMLSPTPLVGNLTKTAKYGRQGSISANVIEASEAYLRRVHKRAMSSEILEGIKDRVTVPGKSPASTLSSYLSTSDLFDNVKGEGYGLAEWAKTNEAAAE